MPAYILDLIIVGVILFGVQFVLGLLSHIIPALAGRPAHIIAYFLAAIVFVVYKYRTTRHSYGNPHKAEIEMLSKAGQPKLEVWKLPDDHDKPTRPTS